MHLLNTAPLLLIPLLASLPLVSAQSSSSAAPAIPLSASAPRPTSTSPPTSASVSRAASISAAPSGPASIDLLEVGTLTACSTYRVQFALRNADPVSHTVTFRVANIGVDQSIRPSGASAPAITSAAARSVSRVIDPATITGTTSSAAASSAIATPTSRPPIASSAAAVTSTSRPAAVSSAAAPALSSHSRPAARRALSARSDIPINGTLGLNPASHSYEWGVNLPAGNYLLTASISQLGVSAVRPVTIIENDSSACLAPWRALSQSLALPSSSATGSGPRPEGSLASAGGSTGSTMSNGAIAGIVVGVVGGLAIIAGLVFWCLKRKRQSRGVRGNGNGGYGTYAGNNRERVDLDMDNYHEKLPSTTGSPAQTWSASSHSPTSGSGSHGIVPMPLAVLPRSRRGSIGSMSAKSFTGAQGQHNGASSSPSYLARHPSDRAGKGNDRDIDIDPFHTPLSTGRSTAALTSHAHAPSSFPAAVFPPARTPAPASSSSGTRTPRSNINTSSINNAERRQSSPPVSPSGWSNVAGDRYSGLASDTAAGRRPSPPGSASGDSSSPAMQRKGSVKRKPVPVLEAGLERELKRSGSLGAVEGLRRGSGNGPGTASVSRSGSGSAQGGVRSNEGGRQEFIIMPDPPRL